MLPCCFVEFVLLIHLYYILCRYSCIACSGPKVHPGGCLVTYTSVNTDVDLLVELVESMTPSMFGYREALLSWSEPHPMSCTVPPDDYGQPTCRNDCVWMYSKAIVMIAVISILSVSPIVILLCSSRTPKCLYHGSGWLLHKSSYLCYLMFTNLLLFLKNPLSCIYMAHQMVGWWLYLHQCREPPRASGVHSGDATLLLPAQRLFVETHRRVKRSSESEECHWVGSWELRVEMTWFPGLEFYNP